MSSIVRQTGQTWAIPTLALLAIFAHSPSATADSVYLKNGTVYRGTVDKDKPVLWIYDGLKRVVIRDSKVERIESDATYRNLETFRIEQPLVVHGGSMPKEVLSVKAGPWSDRGRRPFEYEGSRIGKMIRMEQAINELGPHIVKIRGVDGYWQSQLKTNQVPRKVILAILGKVEQTDKNERIRVARFMIQSEWYVEARAELERILRDFPDDADLRDRVTAARASVNQLNAAQIRASIELGLRAQQPHEALNLVKSFPSEDVSNDLITQVNDLHRLADERASADKSLADELQALAQKLPTATRDSWKKRTLEALQAMKEAPDAVRDRFVAWRKGQLDGGKTPETLFALALSGYVVGADAAVEDLEVASTFWTMRDEVRDYLGAREEVTRVELLSRLNTSAVPGDAQTPEEVRRLEIVTRLALRMPPPLGPNESIKAGTGLKIHRVRDDDNSEPTEYAVSLPPEYHPLRSYPTIVALHDGNGPDSAIAWWSAEAALRGYIVIAPEYKVPGQGKEYLFSSSEHAAVELAIRDAKRRYAVDSDRVFIGGQLTGANMAWDFGLAHPDQFAGVAVVSGLPFKYVNRYLSHVDLNALYVVEGDLAPAANEFVFGQILKPMITTRSWDVTYVEYMKRGMENFPEEAPPIFDWMDRRHREPFPKAFSVVTARESDNRFFGVVVREFTEGRTTAPEAVEPLGKNLNPATIKVTSSALSNLLNVTTSGVKRLDIWVSPKLVDFRKKVEVRVNNSKRPAFKAMAKPDLGPLLEDLRLRGDRQQIYWMKVSVG